MSSPLKPEPWHWIAFAAFVVVVLVLDLVVFHRKVKEPTLRESAVWTVIWCLMAVAFNGLLWVWARNTLPDPKLANQIAMEFLLGYLIEWSLSMDNVFVFAVVFTFFRVPLKYQHRVLFWGILGAIVMRLTFILIGAELLKHYDWVMAVFGALLVYTAIKLALSDESEVHPENNILMRLARRIFPVAKGSHGNRFFVREMGVLCITPLFLVLLVVESTDVMFAVDSVPAIFGITKNPFIVFTSNVFAILGLRALYFLLAGVMDLFRYLRYGLAAILGFVGVKMIAEYAVTYFRKNAPQHVEWLGDREHLVPHWVSLAVIVVVLGVAIGASLVANRREAGQPAGAVRPPEGA
jgi:tellurite resistance protein TerC